MLVTGGAGFIGTNLIKRLLKEGHDVCSVDNYDSGISSNHQQGCKYYNGDISIMYSIDSDALKGIDVVYHLAGLSRIQPSFTNPTETFRVNTCGTEVVLEWARKNNVKVIYAGSSSRWHNPYQSPYALYKQLGEEICKMYKKVYGLDVEIARFYNVYGPHEIIDGDWAAVTGIWRRQVRDGESITIVGDGEQRRDFTHVDDIVDGLYKIAVSTKKHKDAWELGTGINYSVNEVYEMFKEKFGIKKINIPNQDGNYRHTLRENNDAINELGWKPTDQLQQYINEL